MDNNTDFVFLPLAEIRFIFLSKLANLILIWLCIHVMICRLFQFVGYILLSFTPLEIPGDFINQQRKIKSK